MNEIHNNELSHSRPFTFDRVVRIIFAVVVVLAILWVVTVLKSVLLPFLVAWLIAYMLEPFVQYNKRLLRMSGRWLAIVMTLFETCLVLCAVGVFVLPSVMREMHTVAVFISQYVNAGTDIPFISPEIHQFLKENIDFAAIAQQMTREDWNNVLDMLGSFVSGGFDFVMGVFNWFITALYVIFIMLDYERLLRGFKRMVVPKYRQVIFSIADDVKKSMNHYFRGQAIIASLVGILFAIGFSIVGMPLAIVMGLFIGLLNMVPYLQLISFVPTTLLCMVASTEPGVEFWPLWWSCMAVYVVVQCIQDLFLTPKIMGKAMGLNPAVILLSLSIWGTLMGFIGLIIALPLTTLLLSYYDHYIIACEDDVSEEVSVEDTPKEIENKPES